MAEGGAEKDLNRVIAGEEDRVRTKQEKETMETSHKEIQEKDLLSRFYKLLHIPRKPKV